MKKKKKPLLKNRSENLSHQGVPSLVRAKLFSIKNVTTIIPLGLALLFVTLLAYWQVGNHEFIRHDDQVYVYENHHVLKGLSWNNIAWALTSTTESNWHPLTWISHMADVEFFGVNPGAHHLMSVAIHAAATAALLVLLLSLTGSPLRSLFVAAVFALHPMHVESVAWVAERKDVLSALFGFLTLYAYSRYAVNRGFGLYLLTLACFVLGLMSKPMLVTWPLVMLLLDVWPLERLARREEQLFLRWPASLLVEKIPFFACSIGSSIVTFYAQLHGGTVATLEKIPLVMRLGNASFSYVNYLSGALWPRNLAVFYPFPEVIPPWQPLCALVVLLIISAASLRVWRSQPWLAVGWFWFVITLIPVIGIVQVGSQSMADRYSYIPFVGLTIMLAWGLPPLIKHFAWQRTALVTGAIVAVLLMAVASWQQISYWRDTITLFRHTLNATTRNHLAHFTVGICLAHNNDFNGAVAEFRKSLAIYPNDAEVRNNLGLALFRLGNQSDAIKEFKAALALTPNNVDAHFKLGICLAANNKDLAGAAAEYRKALYINPQHIEARYNLGNLLFRTGDKKGAAAEYRNTLSIKPDHLDTLINLGAVLIDLRDFKGAIRELGIAASLAPDNLDVRDNFGVALMANGDIEQAIAEFKFVLSVDPNNTFARNNLIRAHALRDAKKPAEKGFTG